MQFTQNILKSKMTKSSIENELHTKGEIVYTNVGDSMYPLIRPEGDIIIIKKCNGNLKKYDIPLYKRTDGSYILHRVLNVKADGSYIMCGDNRWRREKGISDENILGILSCVVRDGKENYLSGFKYRLYVFFWCRMYYIRAIALIIKGMFVPKKRRSSKNARNR